MTEALSKEVLEAANCWEAGDRVPGRPAMTDFRRRVRYHQARWREAKGHPIGSQPIAPKPGGAARPVGSRLPLDYARDTGANFLTVGAREAARARTSIVEPNQSLDRQRLWADLLWSPAFAFNLFGDLAADLGLADGAVHTWWPDVPGRVSAVRFLHSPGRLDPAYLGNLSEFDCAFVLDLGGTRGIIGVGTRYHDRIQPETPKPARAPHYRRVAETSNVFDPRAIDSLSRRGPLLVTWLHHLLMLSMLQHPRGEWRWGRFVIVHPARNTDFSDACARYRELLLDRATFSSMTLEDLLDAHALTGQTEQALRDRYVPSR